MTDTTIAMPEGKYKATYQLAHGWWEISIPGGIAAPGKAEDAHNVGIDGTWGASVAQDDQAPTIHAACAEVAQSIIAERNGWTLPFPMAVWEAEKLRRWSAGHAARNGGGDAE